MGLFSNVALAKSREVYAFEPSKTMCERYFSKYENSALHVEEYALTDSDAREEMFIEYIYGYNIANKIYHFLQKCFLLNITSKFC